MGTTTTNHSFGYKAPASEAPRAAATGFSRFLARDDDKYTISTSDAADFEHLSSIFKLQYTSDGVHRQLSSSRDIRFSLSDREDTVTYRRPRANGSLWGHSIPFYLFTHPAVNPPVRRLVIVSKQLPWRVDVSVERDCVARFVSVGDVLDALKRAAWTRLTESEHLRALESEDGLTKLRVAHEIRCLGFSEVSELEDEPYRRVDALGEFDIFGGLRKDVDNAACNELIPGQRSSSKQRTLVLVADILSNRSCAARRV